MALLRRNPHNATYYHWLEEVAAKEDRVALYERLRNELPRGNDCVMLRSLTAAAVAGDRAAVKSGLAEYVEAKLSSGPAPGLFSSVQTLYEAAPEVSVIIGEVMATSAAVERPEQVGGSREMGVDIKEDLAGRNVFLTVALGLCAAVVPECYRLSLYRYPLLKTSFTGSVGGWGYFVDFVAEKIKECLPQNRPTCV